MKFFSPPNHRRRSVPKKHHFPIDAIYAVVQKIHLDESMIPDTAPPYQDTKEESSQTPGCWMPPDVDSLPTSTNLDKHSREDNHQLKT